MFYPETDDPNTPDIDERNVQVVEMLPELNGNYIDEICFMLDPEGLSASDNYRINTIGTIESEEADDWILPFEIYSDEGTVDGDKSPERYFTVEVDGLGLIDNTVGFYDLTP